MQTHTAVLVFNEMEQNPAFLPEATNLLKIPYVLYTYKPATKIV